MKRTFGLLLWVAIVLCGTGPLYAQNPAEELPGTYRGETVIHPNQADLPSAPTGFELGSPKFMQEYTARVESLTGHSTDSFEIVRPNNARPGQECILRNYRDGTYYINPYSEGDLIHYWNESQGNDIYYAVFDITTDGVHKIGELSLTHVDTDRKVSDDYHRLDLWIALSPEDFYVRWENGRKDGLYRKITGKYFKTSQPTPALVAYPNPFPQGLPWKTVVGLGAAAAVSLSAVARAMQKPASRKAEKQDPERTVGYILQLSADQITLKPGDSKNLGVTVWKIDAMSRTAVAGSAAVQLSSDLKGLAVQPAAGGGRLTAVVSARADADSGKGSIHITASAGGGVYQSVVSVKIDAEALEIITDPRDKKVLLPDGKDGCWILARVQGDTTGKLTDSIQITARGESSLWLNFSDPQTADGWKMRYVRATNPGNARGNAPAPPSSFTVTVTATLDNRPVSRNLSFSVPAPAELDARPDLIELAAASREKVAVQVWLENGGEEPWKFSARYQEKNRPLADFELRENSTTTATLTLTEANLKPAGSDLFETSVLKIFAEPKDGTRLERHIKIVVGREGLQIDPKGSNEDGVFMVAADGSQKVTEIDFRVFVFNPIEKKIVSNPDLAKDLNLTIGDGEATSSRNALAFGNFTHVFKGIRAVSPPSGTYQMKIEKPIPSDGSVIPVRFKVNLAAKSGDSFSGAFHVGLRTSGLGVGGKDWKIELEKCQRIISDFVPAAYWPKLQELLDKRKMTLGPEGLFYLRKKIWKITEQLILAEGEHAYEDEAKWAGHCVQLCEWVEWGSDLAFESIATAAYGPHGGLGAKILKDLIKSSLAAYAEGKSASEWFNDQLTGMLKVAEGKGIDEAFKYFEKEPAKAWALYVSYAFFRNVVKGDSLWDAATGAMGEAGTRAVGDWIVKKIVASPRFTEYFKTDVGENQAVFWSGQSGKAMASKNGSPMGKTEGGKWGQEALAELGLGWEDARKSWVNLSRKYAQQAKGNVKVFLENGYNPKSIFAEVEYPELLSNPNVKNVQIFVKKGGSWVLTQLVKS